MVKNLPARQEMQETEILISGSGRSPGGGHANALQYSCLENPMHRRTWRSTVHYPHKESYRAEGLSL